MAVFGASSLIFEDFLGLNPCMKSCGLFQPFIDPWELKHLVLFWSIWPWCSCGLYGLAYARKNLPKKLRGKKQWKIVVACHSVDAGG